MSGFYEFAEIPSRGSYKQSWELRAKIGQNQNLHEVGRIAERGDGRWSSEVPSLGGAQAERRNDHPSRIAALKYIIEKRREDMERVRLMYETCMAEFLAAVENED